MAEDNNRRRRRQYESDWEDDWDEYYRKNAGIDDKEYVYAYDDDDEYDETPRRTRNERRKKQKKLSKKRKRSKTRRAVLITLIAVMFVSAIVGSGVMIGMYAAVRQEVSDMNINNLALNMSSFIYYTDSNGKEHELEQITSSENRIWVDSDEIAQVVKDALVSIEDQRFYSHHGFDIKRTIGATAKYALSKIGIGSSTYGGSTITQQVIKNITNESTKSPTRKIKEIMRAIALEKELSKDEILTMYLNVVYFANGCYGIEAAANKYYNKSASELELTEAAAIVGITQTPAKYDPIAHPDNCIEKRNRVLAKMYELGYITEDEYDEAVDSDLDLAKSSRSSGTKVSSYFVDALVNDVIADLQSQRGYSEAFAYQQLQNGGLKIYATIDPDVQEAIEIVFENKSNFADTNAQAAIIVQDPYTGEIKGMAGGMGTKTDVRGFNRATQMKRQPGSAIKPLAVYTPALEKGVDKDENEFTEATILDDNEREFVGGDGEAWIPKNSYSTPKGNMTAKKALEVSSNVAAVSVLEDYLGGVSTSYDYLENKFGITSLDSDSDRNYAALALGGLTNGVSPKEMAAAYSVFVNEGKYIKPYTYTRIEDYSGKTVLENKASSTQVIKPSTAYIISDMLYNVVNGSNGTAKGKAIDGHATYGKTGTTNDNYDKWFVGFTGNYVAAAWYGFDTPKTLGGENSALNAWYKVMQRIHSNLDEKELEKPSNIVEKDICMTTGLLAKSGCTSETMYFDTTRPGPDSSCTKHSGSKSSSSSSKSTQAPSSEQTSKPDEDEDEDSGDSGGGNNLKTSAPAERNESSSEKSQDDKGDESSGGSSDDSDSGSGSGAETDAGSGNGGGSSGGEVATSPED